ncbi:MAG: hypothetical protein ACK4GN_03305 [Runella sp.]
MKQKRLFLKTTSATLAMLLLLLAMVGQWVSSSGKVVEKPKAEQSQSDSDEQPVLQELSLEAVVAPALTFDFEQSFYFLPTVLGFTTLSSGLLPKRFAEFYYFFSFFRNVFGHHIATNAP